jgi:group I intron endonuclease
VDKPLYLWRVFLFVKNLKGISGIYHIINKVNGKYYIGRSKNLHVRRLSHFNKLRKNKHDNIYLQRAFNNQKESDFEFIVIEFCDNLKEREQCILNELDLKKCYNISLSASGGDLISNHPNKADIIKRTTKTINNLIASLSPSQIKEKFSYPLEKNPNWKGGKTFCKCGNRINSGTKSCMDCCDKSGVKNPFYGKKHSQDFKNKRRIERLGNYNGNQERIVIIGDKEYKSVSESARQLSVVPATILFRIKSKHFKEYNYK